MGFSLIEGFTKSLAMTILSEIGDSTFIAAAILAMRYPRRLVLGGCLSASIAMTVLTVLIGWVAPNLISRKWTHHITTLLFFGFGLWSLWEGFTEEDEDELAEVEAKLDKDLKSNTDTKKPGSKVDDDQKKQQRPVLTHFFSPIFLKAFSITFFGEWGDTSQVATIGLAADVNPIGVVLGGIIGQALCTVAAVLGGKSLASKISERAHLCIYIFYQHICSISASLLLLRGQDLKIRRMIGGGRERNGLYWLDNGIRSPAMAHLMTVT